MKTWLSGIKLCSNCEHLCALLDDVNRCLMKIILRGHPVCVESLIEAGADVNTTDGYTTPLMWALGKEYTECVKLLVKAGADVNQYIREYGVWYTPLMWLAKNGGTKYTNLLIELGADVNVVRNDGFTALMSATQNGRYECAETLTKLGANVNAKNIDGETALMFAAKCGAHECIDVLIKAGADVNLVNKDGVSALLFQSRRKINYHCLDLLLKAGADVNYGATIVNVATKGNLQQLELLIKAGADVNRLPVIVRVADQGSVEHLELLIQAGADVNTVDESGDTALMRAADKNKIDQLRVLLGNKVKIVNERRMSKAAKPNNFDKRANVHSLMHRNSRLAPGKFSVLSRYVVSHRLPNLDVCMLLYAAGETTDSRTVEKLFRNKVLNRVMGKEKQMGLRHLCRQKVREHLLELNPHGNLFHRVPKLGLPKFLTNFMLYNVSLEREIESQ